jgi:ubiquinone/menaquinone biosynthesis C-methylase UbiE
MTDITEEIRSLLDQIDAVKQDNAKLEAEISAATSSTASKPSGGSKGGDLFANDAGGANSADGGGVNTDTNKDSGYVNYSDAAKTYDKARDPLGDDIILGAFCASKTGVPLHQMRILDAGCGTGNYVRVILPKVGFIEASDYSDAMVDKGKEKYKGNPKVNFVVGSMADMPYGDNEYDGIMCNQVIQHVETAETMADRTTLKKCMAEALRVLKPGGILNISTRSKEPQYHDLYWYCEFFPQAVLKQTTRVPDKDLVRQIMIDAGFEFLDACKPNYRSIMSMEHLLNPEGPFDKNWRRGESFWSAVSEEELEVGLKKIRAKIEDGSIQAFIERKEKLRKMNGQVLFLTARKPKA